MRGIAISVVTFSLLGVAGWYGLHFIPADFSYGVEAEFEELPTSDEKLEQWVQGKSCVFRAWVERKSVGARTRLLVTIGMTQNLWRDPPFPDLTLNALTWVTVDSRAPLSTS